MYFDIHYNIQGKYASSSSRVSFIRGKIALLKMQLNYVKEYLSCVKEDLETDDDTDLEYYTVEYDSVSGSDEIDEF